MTDTPRTDAAAEILTEVRLRFDFIDFVDGDFARTLERELARMDRLRHGADADRRLLRGELEKERAKVDWLLSYEGVDWIISAHKNRELFEGETDNRAVLEAAMEKERAT